MPVPQGGRSYGNAQLLTQSLEDLLQGDAPIRFDPLLQTLVMPGQAQNPIPSALLGRDRNRSRSAAFNTPVLGMEIPKTPASSAALRPRALPFPMNRPRGRADDRSIRRGSTPPDEEAR